jgi:hypothetical protein
MQSDEEPILEYDLWRWHTEGKFPKNQPPEHGYVHIGVFVAWLANNDMLDEKWIAESHLAGASAAIRDRTGSPSALRDGTDGRLGSEMLTAEGQAFASAYYAPEYGYPRDWRRAFGRNADHYAVPDDWATYDWIAPLIDRRHREWIDAGRPDLLPMPRFFTMLLRMFRTRAR